MKAGGTSRAIRSGANASCATSAGPKIAQNAAIPTISAPTASPACSSLPNSNTRGSEIRARGRAAFAIGSGGPQPRVEGGVREIGDEGEQHVDAVCQDVLNKLGLDHGGRSPARHIEAIAGIPSVVS